MKRMEEHETLHLGNSIRDWRRIARCIRNTAPVVFTFEESQELIQLAERIEMHLPSRTDGAPK